MILVAVLIVAEVVIRVGVVVCDLLGVVDRVGNLDRFAAVRSLGPFSGRRIGDFQSLAAGLASYDDRHSLLRSTCCCTSIGRLRSYSESDRRAMRSL